MSMFSSFYTATASVLVCSIVVNASVNNGIDLRILPLGASITWGQDSTDGNGYRLTLANLLEAQGHKVTYVGTVSHGTMSNNLCEAYPGDTISEVDALASASGAYDSDPNIVLIHLGTNDCAAQRQDITTAPQRFATLLSHLNANSPDALILMSSLIHNKNPAIEACLTTLNLGLASVAKTAADQGQKVQFVDMVDAVPWSGISSDGTHPTDEGYAIMAQKWADSIFDTTLSILEPGSARVAASVAPVLPTSTTSTPTQPSTMSSTTTTLATSVVTVPTTTVAAVPTTSTIITPTTSVATIPTTSQEPVSSTSTRSVSDPSSGAEPADHTSTSILTAASATRVSTPMFLSKPATSTVSSVSTGLTPTQFPVATAVGAEAAALTSRAIPTLTCNSALWGLIIVPLSLILTFMLG